MRVEVEVGQLQAMTAPQVAEGGVTGGQLDSLEGSQTLSLGGVVGRQLADEDIGRSRDRRSVDTGQTTQT